ncbi:VirB4 family type IV secretion/conjugal transfer ATPase [Rickettsiales endosymbiont of Stachyamoeba lipophora]|uniref:VirB4 family type IV secretion/conjugal transfer ATPase n=1 Tax=Rickettsiales endosymbiont of Stachyamoeba lipophora TaxID=2486578 RepID=UPI000F654913|nr:hypothetical protein [Rickettsiales endosymbiont of Stachyamoeba lipophora]AZL16143.1 hypothetical protein EF513_06315 [Rickettsiales endosymbiont of Stachyamoeba lipophora]
MSNFVNRFFNKISAKKTEFFQLAQPSSDLIPFVTHIDDHNVLLKNGHVIQSLKIVGFSNDIVDNSAHDIRNFIRQAFNKHITDPRIAIWINTIRTRRNLDPGGRYNNPFCQDLHQEWNKKNYWHDKYINEVYITLVYSGTDFKIKNLSDLLSSSSFYFLSKKHFREIANIKQKLNQIANHLCEELKVFGVTKLGIYQNNEGVLSETLEFLTKIINLEDKKRLLPIVDLCEYLNDYKIAFGNNTFEIISDKNKHFGAIITFKEYHEIKSDIISKFMTLPIEMVITQTISFIDKNIAEKDFKYQNYILGVSLDLDLKERLGIDGLLSNNFTLTDFGHSQTSIMVSGDTPNQLNQHVNRILKIIDDIGFVAFREDLNMEDIFWSQLPGNFEFIRRKTPISSKQFSGFAVLNNTTSGNKENIWGKAVTLFRTAVATPYFFNFHHETKGNTVIIGSNDVNKTLLFNFLLSISNKYLPQTLIISSNNRSLMAASCLGAKVYPFSQELEQLLFTTPYNLIDISNDLNVANLHEVLMGILYNFAKSNTKKKPLIIAFDDFSNIPFHQEFIDYIEQLSNAIYKSNGIFLIATNAASQSNLKVFKEFTTKLVTNQKLSKEQALQLGIKNSDIKYIQKLSQLLKEFMIIKPNESVIAELNLAGLDSIIKILESDEKAYKLYSNHKDQKDWLALIYNS